MSPEALWHRLTGADEVAALYTLLAATAGRGTLLLALGGLTVLALRRRAAATRHLAWTALMFGLVVLPVLIAGLPRIVVPLGVLPAASIAYPLPPAEPTRAPRRSDPPPAPASPRGRGGAPAPLADAPTSRRDTAVRLDELLVFVWLFGFALSVTGMSVSLARLGRLRRTACTSHPRILQMRDALALRVRLTRRVRVLEIEGAMIPFTWGIVRPVILLPPTAREWPDSRLEAVLLHELAHVRRWDAVGQLLARCACALHWYNPLVWNAARQLARECEYACDDHVVSRGLAPADYAGELLNLARLVRDQRRAGAIAVLGTGELGARIRALLSPDRCRTPLGARALGMGAAAGGCVLLLTAAAAPSRTPAPDPQQAARPPGRARVHAPEAVETPSDALSHDGLARAASTRLAPGGVADSTSPGNARGDDRLAPVEAAEAARFGRVEPLVSAVLAVGAPARSPLLSVDVLAPAADTAHTSIERRTPGADGSSDGVRLSTGKPIRPLETSWDAEVRLPAAELARRLGSSRDAEARRRAAWALRGRGGDGARSLSRAILHDDAAEVREMAAWALAGEGGADVAEALVRVARGDEDASVRFTAFWALEQDGSGAAERALSAAIRDPSLALRQRALWYAGANGLRTHVPELVTALSDADPQSRKAAAWSLGSLRARGITPAVRPLLDDPDVEVRKASLWALLRSDDADARAAIREARSNSSPVVRGLAARAETGQWRSWAWTWPMPRPRTRP